MPTNSRVPPVRPKAPPAPPPKVPGKVIPPIPKLMPKPPPMRPIPKPHWLRTVFDWVAVITIAVLGSWAIGAGCVKQAEDLRAWAKDFDARQQVKDNR